MFYKKRGVPLIFFFQTFLQSSLVKVFSISDLFGNFKLRQPLFIYTTRVEDSTPTMARDTLVHIGFPNK